VCSPFRTSEPADSKGQEAIEKRRICAPFESENKNAYQRGRNTMPTKRMTVLGSEKKALPNAKVIGNVDPDERIEITVVLRPRTSTGGVRTAKAAAEDLMKVAARPLEQRRYVSRESFASQRGADPEDIEKVEAFAEDHKLTVVEVSIPKRSIRLSGTIRDLTAAFRPNLKKTRVGNRILRTRTGGISVPKDLVNSVVAVLGFDNRPVARPHFRFLKGAPSKRGAKRNGAKGKKAIAHNAPDGSFSPPEIARLYNFPTGLDGSGQCIGIIELNDFDENTLTPSGTGFTQSDLKAYFNSLGLTSPQVTAVGVASDGSHGANVPGPDPNADGEVMLDIEVAGAVAPKARIAVYFALNTDNGFLTALNTALHDTVRKPSVVSISWGSAEHLNTQQARNAFDQALQDAAALGVTVCCSSGDDGSSDIRRPQDRDGRPHVDFPASSPFALACGGTKLLGSGSTINSEVVWNDGDGATGGGVSNFFARPAYQSKAKVPKSPTGKTGRGVPDVAGDADPNTGYQVRLVGGQRSVIGGTSAVSPLWAGLIALMNQRLAAMGKPAVGFLNPMLYPMPSTNGNLHDVMQGNNDIEGLGKYKARAKWDPCTGLGTPDGTKLLTALGG
jgi:kumamolisin